MDTNLIHLYLERSERAISETKKLYGAYCDYIAGNILGDPEASKLCTEKSYTRLWETIPPRKPQNLKMYLYKITRTHALYMWEEHQKDHTNENMDAILDELQECYPEPYDETVTDAGFEHLRVELALASFLKELSATDRALFLQRYWYFGQVSEGEGNKLRLLRFQLNEVLRNAHILLQGYEIAFLHVMTEIEDRYLEDVVIFKKEIPVPSIQPHFTFHVDRKRLQQVMGIAAALMIVLLLGLAVSKTSGLSSSGTEGSSQADTSSQSGTASENEQTATDLDIDSFVWVQGLGYVWKSRFVTDLETRPWSNFEEISTLPVYANHAYDSACDKAVYLDSGTMSAIGEGLVEMLGMTMLSSKYNTATTSEGTAEAYSLEITTDQGSVTVNGDGSFAIGFFEGASLGNNHQMSNRATLEEANNTVSFLLEKYANIINMDGLVPNCYITYDKTGGAFMNYRATGSCTNIYDIADYYFKQVEFTFSEQLGLTGITCGDPRKTAECIGYFPIISYEEALQQINDEQYYNETAIRNAEDVFAAEIVYLRTANEEYFQPYYCFYIDVADVGFECRYIPAIAEIPDVEGITFLDMSEYVCLDAYLLFHKDGNYYTITDGMITQLVDYIGLDFFELYGSDELRETENGYDTIYQHRNVGELNLTEILNGKGNFYDVHGYYMDGIILIQALEKPDEEGDGTYVTYFTYAPDTKQLVETVPSSTWNVLRVMDGMRFYFSRYGTDGSRDTKLAIVDLFTGKRVSTDILCGDIDTIHNSCVMGIDSNYFVIQCKSGELCAIDKVSGKTVEKVMLPSAYEPSKIIYQDGLFYIQVAHVLTEHVVIIDGTE